MPIKVSKFCKYKTEQEIYVKLYNLKMEIEKPTTLVLTT